MKRKKIRQLLALMICGSMVFGGCGKNSETESENASSENQEVAASESSTADETVTVSTLKVTADMAGFKDDDVYSDWKSGTYTEITLSGNTAKAGENGTGTTIKDGVITINQSGTYVFSGNLDDGQIVVAAGENEDVRIVLNGASITCEDGPAIVCTEADKVIISLEEGTENVLADGDTYASDEYTAVIYSKTDLVFNGTGSLTVEANYNNGIQGKDDLRILEGVFVINSVDDALVGKDKVAIKDGIFDINAGGDGIKSTNAEDEEKGFIYIGNGTFDIESGADGIQAETGMLIEDGDFSIVADGGAANAVAQNGTMGGGMFQNSTTEENTGSKGIKAAGCLDITGGTFVVDASDDTLHTNYAMTIDDGDFTLTAGDDAVHGDVQLILNGGTFLIPECVEGLESADLIINGGEFDITASDDAINGAGGTMDTSQVTGQMPGGGEMPEGMEIPEGMEMPEGMELPEGMEMPEGMEIPEGMELPEGMEIPEGMELPEGMEMPEGMELPEGMEMPEGSATTEGGNMPQDGQIQGGRGGNMDQNSMNGVGGKDATGGTAGTAPTEGNNSQIGQNQWAQNGMGGRGQMGGNGQMGQMQGGMGMLSTSSGTLTINGGYIVARSDGDGIDVNGSVAMTGGTVIVEGPTNDGNAALDYDYTFTVDGGTFIAVGSSGMMQTISSNSQLAFITAVFDGQAGGQTVTLKDTNGNVIVEYTPSKAYESFIFASADLKEGQTYQVYTGEKMLAEVAAA